MPIYEYYCPDNHTVYQFYAKTLAQGKTVPKCPDNPKFKLKKLVSAFAVTKGGKGSDDEPPPAAPQGSEDTETDLRMQSVMGEIERDIDRIDENDPKSMARMMRRLGDAAGEKFDPETEEVVRKMEEGTNLDAFEEQFSETADQHENADPYSAYGSDASGAPATPADPKEPRHRFKARKALRRDPKLYDYD